ncbi:MAG: heat-inducible transcriptional repressor HrcA [Lentilitoribacter sp.]
MLAELDDRSREVFKSIVETYLGSGEPLGSRSLSRLLPMTLSPASVRNVMSDLEELGLIYSPHVSAGRLPTQSGLRFFIDAFMQVGDLQPEEREQIEQQVPLSNDQPVEGLLTEASKMLSGLSSGAGLVIAAKNDSAIKHIEFIRLEPTKALAVIVGGGDRVENRVIDLPAGTTSSQLTEASNFLNAHLAGRTFSEVRGELEKLRNLIRRELDTLSSDLVERGLAVWADDKSDSRQGSIIVRGRSKLLENVAANDELERLRLLFDDLEKKESLIELMNLAEEGSGVRIFIGSENKLFSLSGSSLVFAPLHDEGEKVVGAVGIIGPTRLNYSRVVPVVDYTAQLVSRLMQKS